MARGAISLSHRLKLIFLSHSCEYVLLRKLCYSGKGVFFLWEIDIIKLKIRNNNEINNPAFLIGWLWYERTPLRHMIAERASSCPFALPYVNLSPNSGCKDGSCCLLQVQREADICIWQIEMYLAFVQLDKLSCCKFCFQSLSINYYSVSHL